jgi:hypothetical protein
MENANDYLNMCEFEHENGQVVPCGIKLEKVTLEFSLPYAGSEPYRINIHNDELENRAIIEGNSNGQIISEGEAELLLKVSKFLSFFAFGHFEEVDE